MLIGWCGSRACCVLQEQLGELVLRYVEVLRSGAGLGWSASEACGEIT